MRFKIMPPRETVEGLWSVDLYGEHETARSHLGPGSAMTYLTTATGETPEAARTAAKKFAKEEATGERAY